MYSSIVYLLRIPFLIKMFVDSYVKNVYALESMLFDPLFDGILRFTLLW